MRVDSCPACGAAFAQRIPYPGKDRKGSPLEFSEIALCPRCGLGMALPAHTQAELDAFYAAGTYWSETVGGSRVQTLHECNQCRHRARLALKLLPAKTRLRVLDVGAGHGWTEHWLGKLAPGSLAAFEFIEPDPVRSGEISTRSRRIPVTRVESLEQAKAGYHIIFLSHVLEHVADPVRCLQQICGLLAEGGIAYFEMPHADQRFKADVFPHTWFFTLPALGALARHAGAREVLRESFGRLPSSSPLDVIWRAGFHAAAELGLGRLAGFFDDRVWRYAGSTEGIWLRWIVGR